MIDGSVSASEIVSKISSGAINARAIVDATLVRIAAINPKVNAFTDVVADRARQTADALDAGTFNIAEQRIQHVRVLLVQINVMEREELDGIFRLGISGFPGRIDGVKGIGINLPVGFEGTKRRHQNSAK